MESLKNGLEQLLNFQTGKGNQYMSCQTYKIKCVFLPVQGLDRILVQEVMLLDDWGSINRELSIWME